MQFNDRTQTFCLNGKLKIGDLVLSVSSSDYPCMVGTVIQICPKGTPEHDSGNSTDDVFVNFEEAYSAQRIKKLEKHFAKLYGIAKLFSEIPMDSVIMCPDELLRITGIEDEIYKKILCFESDAQKFASNLLEYHQRAEKVFKHSSWESPTYNAVHIDWRFLEQLLSKLLSGIFNRQMIVYISREEYDNWEISLLHSPMNKWEQELLFQLLDADDYEREANRYSTGTASGLSQGLSRTLVSKALPFFAAVSLPDDDGIWFISNM